ncbi:MAG TPA: histidine phosphatase family protein [Pyrinomonadaceae bacterium]|nr:histidine phosphatase family protein [Pyrinomonadaceae bacterium]
MKDIWFIRHAESLANIGEATSTPREIPLSPAGLKQAAQLADTLAVKPDQVFISRYDRTKQTVGPLLAKFPDVTVETALVHEFTYLSIERCRGTNMRQRKPWVEEYWQTCDPHYCDGGQSESFAEFISRIQHFVRELRDRDFGLAYVFTHEQVIKGLMWSSMRLSPEVSKESMNGFYGFMTSFKIPNASVQRTLLEDDGRLYFGSIDTVDGQLYA